MYPVCAVLARSYSGAGIVSVCLADLPATTFDRYLRGCGVCVYQGGAVPACKGAGLEVMGDCVNNGSIGKLNWIIKRTNEEKERDYFEAFAGVYNIPKGEIIFCDRPDVIIDGKQKIGVEITELFKKPGGLLESEQQQREIRKEVLNKAFEKFSLIANNPIDIVFYFDLSKPIQDKNQLIEKIVVLAKENEFSPIGKISYEYFENIPELRGGYCRPVLHDTPEWQDINAYDVPFISIDRLKEIIKTKEKKAGLYTPCDIYWLLIVVEFWDPAQDQEIRVEGIECDSEIFDKILVFRTAYNHVVEVK